VGRDGEEFGRSYSRSQDCVEQDAGGKRLESSYHLYADHNRDRGPHSKVQPCQNMDIRSRAACPEISEGIERALGYDALESDSAMVESFPDSVKDSPQFCIQKADWGNPFRIMLKKDLSNEQRQSDFQDNQVIGSFTNNKGQSCIQDNKNNNPFTWSGPSGVLGCTGQRP
jgi:hypothetical protein